MTLRRWEDTQSHSMENLHWKRLRTLHKTDCGMNEWQNDYENLNTWKGWFHSLRGLRCRSEAARLLRLWVQIPQGAWMFSVSVVCCQVEVSATSWSLIQRVLPTVVHRVVWSRNLKNEGALASVRPQCHTKKQNWKKMCKEVVTTCFKLLSLYVAERKE